MESSSQNNYVKLEPFIHQVGGHSSMLCLDERTVCKPLVERELQFYETLPEPLKRFVPSFYGVLRVKILPEDDSYVALIALPPERYSPRTTNNKQYVAKTTGLQIIFKSICLLHLPRMFPSRPTTKDILTRFLVLASSVVFN